MLTRFRPTPLTRRAAVWLKGKGDEFYKGGDYRSAINAYTAALEADALLAPYAPRPLAVLPLPTVEGAGPRKGAFLVRPR